MSSGKTTKYFKYALGEIILVVIGILIALQINNWNEDRKADIKEKNLFANLKLDFESRLSELYEFNSAREVTTSAILELNSLIADKANRPNHAILDALVAKSLNAFKFNEEFRMLDVLFNTGLINDIKNKSLKRQLIEWPQKVEEMLEEQRMHNKFSDENYLPLIAKYISLREVYEKFDFRKYNLPEGQPVTLNKNYDALLSDPLFENHLVVLQILININYIDTKTLISSAEEIISRLDEELN